jgi:GPI mannosyltransferase 4
VSFALGAFVSMLADTYYFASSLSRPIITPWSNFKYNVNALNLAEHGLHPPWTHLLVNLPCLLGPALLIPFIAPQPLRTSFKQLVSNICFLCSISGLILLSSRPHQEFRFLLPIITLLLISLSQFLPPDLLVPSAVPLRSVPKLDRLRISPTKNRGYLIWLFGWISFNLLAGIFMGSLHQSAIVPITQYLSNRIRYTPPPPPCLHPGRSNLTRQTRMIWHRTYPAPDWLFGQPITDAQTSIEIFNLGGNWKRLWELLSESAQVPLLEAKVEQLTNEACDAWYLASNNTLQRYPRSLLPC